MNSGIYIIKNTITNKFYIGSSSNIKKRFKVHKRMLKTNIHHSIHLQRAFNKYGEKNFDFIILELTDDLLNREQYHINTLLPDYNIAKNSKSPMKGRVHSQISIEKMKKAIRPKGIDHGSYGKKLSIEHIKKLQKKKIGSKRTQATKDKMSKTAKNINSWKRFENHINSLKKQVIDNKGNVFNSMSECSKFWNISTQTVCDILKGRHSKTRKGIIFKYKNCQLEKKHES